LSTGFPPGGKWGKYSESLGFPIIATLKRGLKEMDFEDKSLPFRKMLLIGSNDNPAIKSVQESNRCEWFPENDKSFLEKNKLENALLPMAALRFLVDWVHRI
jgi:hypothetical protein